MALFTVNVSGTGLTVTSTEISTDCSSIFIYTIEAATADSINISLTGDHQNEYYTLNGVNTTFSDSVSGISFNTSLTLTFVIENSGSSGIFETCNVTITNTTTSGVFNGSSTRYNDLDKCVGGSSTILYGSLILGPYIFNPDAGGVSGGTDDFTLTTDAGVFLVTVNGQVLDDSEWSQSGLTLTVTPDNGFNSTADEVLVYQTRVTVSTVGNVQSITEVSTTYTQIAGDATIYCTGSGNFTVSLLTAVGRLGEVLNIKNATTGTITIDPDGSETLDGLSTFDLIPGESLTIQSNNVNWIVI